MTRPLAFLTVALRTCGLWLIFLPGLTVATEQNYATWVSATLEGDFGGANRWSDWRYSLGGKYRHFNAVGGTEQTSGRAGLGLRLSRGFTAWAGYEHYRYDNNAAGSFTEQRYWQQLNWTGEAWAGGTFTSRTSLELRDIERRKGEALRLRQRLRVDFPFRRGGGWVWIVSIEPMFNLVDRDWVDPGLTQTRTFAGIGIPLSPSVLLETGYLHQWLNSKNSENQVNHILAADIRFR